MRKLMNKRSFISVLVLPIACATPPSTPSNAEQRGFATANEAADALVDAVARWDVPAIIGIVGKDGEDLIASADTAGDRARADAFVAKAREKRVIVADPTNSDYAWITVGNQDWPVPIPLVKDHGKWYFDGDAGRDEIIKRRIGENELDTLTILRGFAEAQQEYASEPHDGVTTRQYAQKLVSSPGKQDGLSWQNKDGTWGGPIGDVVAKGIAEGYAKRGAPFHGYYFKVLQGQGDSARLGKLDYVVDGAMIGGFALLAWPAEYRVTGVQTFIVSYDDVVYQKDLGPSTTTLAPAIERYDPDASWKRTDDEW
jgi:hypothetical protein